MKRNNMIHVKRVIPGLIIIGLAAAAAKYEWVRGLLIVVVFLAGMYVVGYMIYPDENR